MVFSYVQIHMYTPIDILEKPRGRFLAVACMCLTERGIYLEGYYPPNQKRSQMLSHVLHAPMCLILTNIREGYELL